MRFRWITRVVWRALLSGIVVLTPAVRAAAQYGGFYEDYEQSVPAPRPTARPTPRPAPTTQPRSHLSIRVIPAMDVDPDSARVPMVIPGGTLGIQVDVRCSGPRPRRVDLFAIPLDAGAGVLAPSRGSVPGTGTWITRFRASKDLAKECTLLVVAQDPAGKAPAVSRLFTIQLSTLNPVMVIGDRVLSPVRDSLELTATHRSWRAAISLRTFIKSHWVEDVASELLSDPEMHRIIREAVRLDRERIGASGKWPEKSSFRSYANMESLMSRYWADGGLSLSAATANEAGNVFLAWRRGGGVTVTLSEEVAASVGGASRVVKTGNVLNAVGAAMILLDFWNNITTAETPVEAKEAWYKAGYGSVDLYLANVIGDTFGAAAALPGMFVSYFLNTSYDTLIGGHKRCWFKQMVRVAAAEDLLGESIHDELVANRVKTAMLSPRGLKGTLTDWWLREGPNWDGWMGGCGSWNLSEARGYREAFADRLMRTAEVEVDGVRYHPWSFYYSVSRMVVREKERAKALEMARNLRDLEAAYLQRLHDTRLMARARLISGGGSGPPLLGARVAPKAWRLEDGWRSAQDGSVTLRVRGDDLSPRKTLLLTVQAPDGVSYLFLVPAEALGEVQ